MLNTMFTMYIVCSHRNDLVYLLEEYYYPQDPMGIAMGFPELNKRRDPAYVRDVHQICEEVCL